MLKYSLRSFMNTGPVLLLDFESLVLYNREYIACMHWSFKDSCSVWTLIEFEVACNVAILLAIDHVYNY